jgi:hypothetical protein
MAQIERMLSMWEAEVIGAYFLFQWQYIFPEERDG